MIIAKRNPLMHRQLVRGPGLAKRYSGFVAVAVAVVAAAAMAVTATIAPRPTPAASTSGSENGVQDVSVFNSATETGLEPVEYSLPAARDHIPDVAVDDANARVIAPLQ
jgi:hypothetical protein